MEPERGKGKRGCWGVGNGGACASVFCNVMANETHKQFIKRELSQKRKNDKAKMPQRLSQSAIPCSPPPGTPSRYCFPVLPLNVPADRETGRERVTVAVRKADMDCG